MTNYPSPNIDRGIYPNNPFSQQVTPQGEWTGLNYLHTARDALEPLPPEEWVVEQIIKPGSISIFFGDPGCKKTFSLLDLGTHVASGEDWLGRKVRQGKVLYLDEDMGINELHARIGNNLRANDCDVETSIYWKSMGGLDLGNEYHLVLLEKSIMENGFSLVIIDAFADVIPGKDENAVKEINPILIGIKKIANETNCAFIVIHHTNKGGDYRGSTAISAAADLLVQIKSSERSPKITFKSQKNRYGKPFQFSAELEISEEKYKLVQTSDQPNKAPGVIGKAQWAIIECLSKNGPSFTKDILANPNGASSSSIKQAIPKMVENGYIHRVNEGGRGIEAEYDLTEKGKELFMGK